MRQPRALRLAQLYWSLGQPIPTDLWFQLAELGYEVGALEAQYRA